MIPPVSRDQLIKAMANFDKAHRRSKDWIGWEKRKNHHYAIEWNGSRYPVKKIVSLATKIPVRDFQGGNGAGKANRVIRDSGFAIVDLRRKSLAPRNPNWRRDELILALDLYIRSRPTLPNKKSKAITELAKNLNRLSLLLGFSGSKDLRTPDSVYMKLCNFLRFDPDYKGTGLQAGSKLEKEIWDEFAHDQKRLHAASSLILSEIAEGKSLQVDDDDEFPEGKVVTVTHKRKERNPAVTRKKKQAVLKATGKLACEVCGFDFEEAYGEIGKGFAECHHRKPLSELTTSKTTRLKDLAIVCANCHRMLHRARPWKTVEELKELFELI